MVRHRAVRLFALWCLGVVAVYWLAAHYGWSPFADGPVGGPGGSGGSGGGGYYGGPRHK